MDDKHRGISGTFTYDGAGNIDLNLTSAPPLPVPLLSGCGWTNGDVYPIPVLDYGVTTIGGTLYSFGGASDGVVIANSYKYDGMSWTAIAPLPEGLLKPAVVSDGTSSYIMGGINVAATPRNTLYRYHDTRPVRRRHLEQRRAISQWETLQVGTAWLFLRDRSFFATTFFILEWRYHHARHG